MDESGKVRGYRTRSMALLPRPHRRGAKLSIELLPSKINSANTPVVSSQIATVGDQANFYIQVLPSKSVTKFERLPLSYIVMTNGRMTSTGEFHIEPTKECQNKAVRSIRPEEPSAPTCVFNGTLSFEIKQEMMPYSTLVVYSFEQEPFEIILAESYRFSVANLFENPLTLNATIVPYKPTETVIEPPSFLKDMDLKPIRLSEKVQDKTRVELSFTGEPDSIVGINVFEADGILQGLCNEMTKERLLQYLTQYEQLPLASFPMKTNKRQINEESTDTNGGDYNKRTVSEKDEEQQIMGEQKVFRKRSSYHSNTRFSIFRVIKCVIQLKRLSSVLTLAIVFHLSKVMMFTLYQPSENSMVMLKPPVLYPPLSIVENSQIRSINTM